MSLLDDVPDDSNIVQESQQEEEKVPEDNNLMEIFGEEYKGLPINKNIHNAIKFHKLLRNNQPFYPFHMDNDMHLKGQTDMSYQGLTFEEATLLTKGLCQGLDSGAKKMTDEI